MKPIRLLFMHLALLLVLAMSGCKKVQEDMAMNFLLKAMTEGRWIVDTYTRDAVNETAAFAGYEFQFIADGKVLGIKDGTEKQGTWVGDVNARTIYSNFPGATDPLNKLNDTFIITNNTTKLVEARPLNEAVNVYLKLVKKVQ